MRGSREVIRFRFGLGKIRLNLDYYLVYLHLALKGIYCYNVKDKLIVSYKGIYIVLPSIEVASGLHIVLPSMEVAGTLSELPAFEEMYHVFDFRGKRVLDVGGYCGETACLFRKWGASWVEVYEPYEELFKYVKINLVLNRVSGIAHPLIVDGGSDNLKDPRKLRSWEDLLRVGEFDVAKVDCEGCEEGLTRVDDALLRRVPLWVIECHSASTFKKVAQKFHDAGFDVIYRPYYLYSPWYFLFGSAQQFNARADVPDCLIIMVAKLKTSRDVI